jgi:hypothetical protein
MRKKVLGGDDEGVGNESMRRGGDLWESTALTPLPVKRVEVTKSRPLILMTKNES